MAASILDGLEETVVTRITLSSKTRGLGRRRSNSADSRDVGGGTSAGASAGGGEFGGAREDGTGKRKAGKK